MPERHVQGPPCRRDSALSDERLDSYLFHVFSCRLSFKYAFTPQRSEAWISRVLMYSFPRTLTVSAQMLDYFYLVIILARFPLSALWWCYWWLMVRRLLDLLTGRAGMLPPSEWPGLFIEGKPTYLNWSETDFKSRLEHSGAHLFLSVSNVWIVFSNAPDWRQKFWLHREEMKVRGMFCAWMEQFWKDKFLFLSLTLRILSVYS